MATKKTPAKKAAPKAAKPKVPAKAAKKTPAKRVVKRSKIQARGVAPLGNKYAVGNPGGGRPTLYDPKFPEMCRKLALLGMTDAEMADIIGVGVTAFESWKREHREFSEALDSGKDLADAEVAASLYHRALGYSHPEDDIRSVAMGANAGSEIVITPTIKHYPPDTAAASLWLRNRQQKRWKDKIDVAHSGSLTLEQLPDAEIDGRLQEAFKRLGRT